MKYSHAKHFWTWFQQNSNTLLTLTEMNNKEKEYWLREINTHLRAYTKKLFFELFGNNNGSCCLIITAYGNVKYFRMAEAFVAKAPKMAGWEIVGLQPPGLLGKLLLPFYGRAGIDLTDLWFMPPGERMSNGKIRLVIYAELYKPVTTEMEIAVEAVIYEWLGEKTIGLEIDCIVLENIFELSKQERKALVPVEEIASWITCRDTADMFINEKGIMEIRNKEYRLL